MVLALCTQVIICDIDVNFFLLLGILFHKCVLLYLSYILPPFHKLPTNCVFSIVFEIRLWLRLYYLSLSPIIYSIIVVYKSLNDTGSLQFRTLVSSFIIQVISSTCYSSYSLLLLSTGSTYEWYMICEEPLFYCKYSNKVPFLLYDVLFPSFPLVLLGLFIETTCSRPKYRRPTKFRHLVLLPFHIMRGMADLYAWRIGDYPSKGW